MGADVSSFWSNSNVILVRNFDHDTDAAVAGLHLGYQAQFGQFVVGVEGAFLKSLNGDLEKGTPNSGCPSVLFTCEAELDDIYTVGPRLGWTPNNQWLIYVTGGYANGEIESRSFTTATGVTFDVTDQRHDGCFIGGGADFALTSQVSLGVDYRHIELESEQHQSPTTPGPLSVDARSYDAEADVVTARLTFRHGADPRPEPLK